MNPRQQTILKLIIEEYIGHAEPVGSKFLAERCGLDVSSATIRNDMAVLEEEGFLRQPHTSAGRVPTEQAYLYYLQHFVEAKHERADESRMRQVVEQDDRERTVKMLAKTLVDLSGEMAIVAMGPNWSYYTGVSNLFQKPEFNDLEVVQNLSAMMDRFDEVVGEMMSRVSDEPQVMIGENNPFGKDMSAIVIKYTLPSRHVGFLGLVGPLRMDYARNLGLVESAKELLDQEESDDENV